MNTITERVLFWSPRVLTILFALFLTIFAADVFSEGYGIWQTIGALLLHLFPTFLVFILLIIAWRWPLIGAVLFGALAAVYVAWAWGRFPFSVYLFIAGPVLLVSVLFLLNWIYGAQLRTR